MSIVYYYILLYSSFLPVFILLFLLLSWLLLYNIKELLSPLCATLFYRSTLSTLTAQVAVGHHRFLDKKAKVTPMMSFFFFFFTFSLIYWAIVFCVSADNKKDDRILFKLKKKNPFVLCNDVERKKWTISDHISLCINTRLLPCCLWKKKKLKKKEEEDEEHWTHKVWGGNVSQEISIDFGGIY